MIFEEKEDIIEKCYCERKCGVDRFKEEGKLKGIDIFENAYIKFEDGLLCL